MTDQAQTETEDVLRRMPDLVCPECRGNLSPDAEGLRCAGCGAAYPVRDGIPQLLDGASRALAHEIAVQDRVALEYENKRYADPYSRRYHESWTDYMLEGLDTSGKVLDNGCGIGFLSDRLPADRLISLDISSEMLRLASRRTKNLVLGNSMSLPLKSSSIDLVVCRSLIHHLQTPGKAMDEIHRVLKPGGQAVFADTNTSLLSYLPRRLFQGGEHFSEDHENLTLGKMRAIIEPQLRITSVRYLGFIAYPLLGFPDLWHPFRFFPAKELSYKLLIGLDELLARIPLVRTQGWGLIVKVRKP